MQSTLVVLKKYSIFVFLFVLFGCKEQSTIKVQQLRGAALGTTYAISYSNIEISIDQLKREVDSVIDVMNASMSTYIQSSDISKINRGDDQLVVDEHFVKVYEKATEVWKKTNGYFDPTVGALVNAYGFGPEKALSQMNSKQRDSILLFTGWQKTKLTAANTLWKSHPNVRFDFNALAKGYAVDVVADLLRSKNFNSFLVEIGGEIVAEGVSPKSKKPWKVAVDDPNQNRKRNFIKILSLTDKALATSGNYRKYKIDSLSGKRIVHSINPKTGEAIPSNVLSASVIAPDCMTADAYATALMVMPLDESKALIEREPHLEAYWIVQSTSGTIEEYYSSGFPSEESF